MPPTQITILKNTQASINGFRVGVANIWTRDIAGEQGVIASRLSASVALYEVATQKESSMDVAEGFSVRLGSAVYQVVHIEDGTHGRASLTLQKVESQ